MVDSKVPLLDSQSTPQPPPEQMADVSADRLMHDLFNGVERALDGDLDALDEATQDQGAEAALAEPAPPAAIALDSSGASEDKGTATLLNSAVIANESGDLAAVSAQLAASEDSEILTNDAASGKVPFASRWRYFWTLNRALLGAAGLTMLATVGLWLHQRQQTEIPATAPPATSAETVVDASNPEFLEYLRRSLDVIAQGSTSTPTATTSGDVSLPLSPSGTVGLPPVASNVLPPVASSVPSAPGSVNVIERVYVPYPSSAQTAVPSTTPSTAGTSSASTPNTAATAGTVAVQASHTLLGVLELGDRSAALFEIDGVPQRVYIGERVGTSGWSLVSVANEEAIVRRNGEVRTLYIGQQF